MDTSKIQKLWGLSNMRKDAKHKTNNHHSQYLEMRPDLDESSGLIPREELRIVEQTIKLHESVENAAAIVRLEEIVAFIKLQESNIKATQEKPEKSEWDDEKQQVHFWDGYWDGCTYTAMDELTLHDIGRDFLGWTSMYDGEPIAIDEMNEWLDETIATIQSLPNGPESRVFEVGTGSGMILFNLISGIRSYVGLEMSPTAVDFVKKTAQSMPRFSEKIHMFQGSAADIRSLELPIAPDLVVINSVAQYFPSQEYLIDVIEAILQIPTVETIYFGDIRSYALHQEFLVSKILNGPDEVTSKADLSMRINELLDKELELLIDPAFFNSLSERFPGRIFQVEIHPKRLKAVNELSCFRYAAVVFMKNRGHKYESKIAEDAWIDFTHREMDRESLLRLLQQSGGTVAVSNIKNSKTIFQSLLVDRLREQTEKPEDHGFDHWLATVRKDAEALPSLSTIDLLEIAEKAGHQVEISSARERSQRGGMDAIFHKSKTCGGGEKVKFHFPNDHGKVERSKLAMEPLLLQSRQAIREQIDEHLQSELPVHLLPSSIRIVDEMPTKDDGEVDYDLLSTI
ncbi:unnamed protein product [Periconia digitata]|uniref:Uncharacterized protein n=1 Tax=Periconia digitata TaxID=1303443 RepID=A0A9W4UQW1_9PLEO|nr:unnamed protein product [Periconia digitata]